MKYLFDLQTGIDRAQRRINHFMAEAANALSLNSPFLLKSYYQSVIRSSGSKGILAEVSFIQKSQSLYLHDADNPEAVVREWAYVINWYNADLLDENMMDELRGLLKRIKEYLESSGLTISNFNLCLALDYDNGEASVQLHVYSKGNANDDLFVAKANRLLRNISSYSTQGVLPSGKVLEKYLAAYEKDVEKKNPSTTLLSIAPILLSIDFLSLLSGWIVAVAAGVLIVMAYLGGRRWLKRKEEQRHKQALEQAVIELRAEAKKLGLRLEAIDDEEALKDLTDKVNQFKQLLARAENIGTSFTIKDLNALGVLEQQLNEGS